MPPVPSRKALDALNQRCYDHRYKQWDRFPFPTVLPLWIPYYHPLKEGASVLDIGSGTGLLSEWIQKQGYHVLGLDPSPKMVRCCREKGLNCIQTTFQDFVEKKHSFSLIISCLSFIHIPKEEWAVQFQKIDDLLQSKGLLILALIEGQEQGIAEEASGFPRFFAYTSEQEMQELLYKRFNLMNFIRQSGSISYLLFVFQKKE